MEEENNQILETFYAILLFEKDFTLLELDETDLLREYNEEELLNDLKNAFCDEHYLPQSSILTVTPIFKPEFSGKSTNFTGKSLLDFIRANGFFQITDDSKKKLLEKSLSKNKEYDLKVENFQKSLNISENEKKEKDKEIEKLKNENQSLTQEISNLSLSKSQPKSPEIKKKEENNHLNQSIPSDHLVNPQPSEVFNSTSSTVPRTPPLTPVQNIPTPLPNSNLNLSQSTEIFETLVKEKHQLELKLLNCTCQNKDFPIHIHHHNQFNNKKDSSSYNSSHHHSPPRSYSPPLYSSSYTPSSYYASHYQPIINKIHNKMNHYYQRSNQLVQENNRLQNLMDEYLHNYNTHSSSSFLPDSSYSYSHSPKPLAREMKEIRDTLSSINNILHNEKREITELKRDVEFQMLRFPPTYSLPTNNFLSSPLKMSRRHSFL